MIKSQSVSEKLNSEEKYQCPHGTLVDEEQWKSPLMVAKSKEVSRPGYSPILANEFEDVPEVLEKKIKLLASLIKKSKSTVFYTGAGISRAAGIGDYASKAKNTKSEGVNVSLNRLQAQPTQAHYIITALQKKKYVSHWLQQNHDGLAQKSGFPVSKLNQIHGSWFDRKNPVVMMDDSLNPKHYQELKKWEEKVELCIALGTSLCGMRSDGIAKKAAEKGCLVIINLQQTSYDSLAGLRIYGNLQTVMKYLAKELKIKVTERPCLQTPNLWNK